MLTGVECLERKDVNSSFSQQAYLSDYLRDSYTEQNKFHQKLHPVGFEPQTSRSSL